MGFDHSVDNIAGYDLAIRGNAFDGSSEPGIVWVSRDENGNDLWQFKFRELLEVARKKHKDLDVFCDQKNEKLDFLH